MRLPAPLSMTVLALPILGAAACGSDMPGSERWMGKTFLLDVPAANWVQPSMAGRDIGDFVPQFLIGIQAGTAGNMAITIAPANDGAQDHCSPTTQVTSSGARYPGVEILAPQFPLRIVHPTQPITVNTTIHDFSIVDVLPGDAPAEEGTMTAIVDIAEIYPLFTLIPNVTKEAVCMQLQTFGSPCEVCSFNGQAFCLTIRAVQLGATQTPAPVAPLAATDIANPCP